MRRIMRPSADDAGQPAPGGEAAPDATAPIGEPNPGANPFARPAEVESPPAEEPATSKIPVGGPEEPAEQPAAVEAAAPEEEPTGADAGATGVLPVAEAEPAGLRRRLFRRRPRPVAPPVAPEGEPQPIAEAAVVLPAPEGPAGLDPAEADARPLAGRRARLRRRLRYLRRARELMLRDLGGLVFEIHRTGGGDMTAHAPLVEGKVERLRHLDQESIALERALGAPRGETVVFQPGIGGTCVACGDLYPSDARFCANCGRSTTEPPVTEADAAAADPSPVDPRGTLNLFAPLEAERTAPAEEPAAIEMPAAQPTVTEPATAEEPTQGGEPAAPRHEPGVNGTAPPTLQPGDPLASRERS